MPKLKKIHKAWAVKLTPKKANLEKPFLAGRHYFSRGIGIPAYFSGNLISVFETKEKALYIIKEHNRNQWMREYFCSIKPVRILIKVEEL